MSIIKENDRKWWVTFAMSACLAIVYLDQTGVALTLEKLQRSLGLSTLSIQWVMNAYLLSLAVFMLLGGRLADVFGHRKIFLIGMSIFLIASIFCATATNGWWLIISRAFQGLGGSLLIPTSIVLIANSTSIKERGKMIGISISFASIFLAFGPTIGGLLTQFWSWRLIFWMNVPIGLVSILLTLLAIPKVVKKNNSLTIDWLGFSSLAICITTLVVAFMQAGNWGWGSSIVISLFASSVVFFTLFLLIDFRVAAPFVNLKLFRNTTFLFGNAILFLLQSCHISSAVFWVLYLQTVLGYSAGKAGLFILPVTLPVIFCAQLSGRLADRYGPSLPIMVGMFMAMTGVIWVAVSANYYSYPLLFIGFLLYGLGAPLVIPAAMTSILSSVSHKDHGVASGTANSMRQIGGALGLSIIGAIITNVTHSKISHFISHQTETLRSLDINQLENFLMSQEYNTHGAILDLSINDISIIRQGLVDAYATAFSLGMTIAAFFALIALSLALIMFKKGCSGIVNEMVIDNKINSAVES